MEIDQIETYPCGWDLRRIPSRRRGAAYQPAGGERPDSRPGGLAWSEIISHAPKARWWSPPAGKALRPHAEQLLRDVTKARQAVHELREAILPRDAEHRRHAFGVRTYFAA